MIEIPNIAHGLVKVSKTTDSGVTMLLRRLGLINEEMDRVTRIWFSFELIAKNGKFFENLEGREYGSYST